MQLKPATVVDFKVNFQVTNCPAWKFFIEHEGCSFLGSANRNIWHLQCFNARFVDLFPQSTII